MKKGVIIGFGAGCFVTVFIIMVLAFVGSGADFGESIANVGDGVTNVGEGDAIVVPFDYTNFKGLNHSF